MSRHKQSIKRFSSGSYSFILMESKSKNSLGVGLVLGQSSNVDCTEGCSFCTSTSQKLVTVATEYSNVLIAKVCFSCVESLGWMVDRVQSRGTEQ